MSTRGVDVKHRSFGVVGVRLQFVVCLPQAAVRAGHPERHCVAPARALTTGPHPHHHSYRHVFAHFAELQIRGGLCYR